MTIIDSVTLLFHFLICMGLVAFFYYFIKSIIFNLSGNIAIKIKLTHFYPFEMAKGAVELIIVVCCHYIFIIFLMHVLHVNFNDIGLNTKIDSWLCFQGVLLGIAMMGSSSVLSQFYIQFMLTLPRNKVAHHINDWLSMSRSGWIRHHFHTIEVLPIVIAIFITFSQVCAEEIVFKGVFINYFLSYGKVIALVISTVLFVYMQTFHMPNLFSAVFPMLGALVIGLVGGVLYLKIHSLVPLMIAHITFFVFAVL